jgi:hypothetical protein
MQPWLAIFATIKTATALLRPARAQETPSLTPMERIGGKLRHVLPTAIWASAVTACALMRGPTLTETQGTPGKDLHMTDTRNMPFCEIEVATGLPPDVRV